MTPIIFTIVWVVLLSFHAKAQVNTLPYQQNFEQPFNTGVNVAFIPNWQANQVQTDSRIYQDSIRARSGKFCMGIIPTSGFSADFFVQLNLSNYTNTYVTYYVRSVKAGEGTRPAVISMQTSLNNGASWSTAIETGTFENKDTSGYRLVRYNLPSSAANKPNVRVRFLVSRGTGTGTAAQIVIDDVGIASDGTDIVPPEITKIEWTSDRSISIQWSEALNNSATLLANYTGIGGLSSAVLSNNNQTVTLQYSTPFSNGTQQQLNINNIEDAAGNKMSPYYYRFIFNNSVPEIAITEIMYNTPESNNDSLEYIELYNYGTSSAALGGLKFTDGIVYEFPVTTLAPGAYLLIGINSNACNAFYGQTFLQWTEGALNNAGEKLVLKNSIGATIDSIHYSPFWGGDGDGYSLVLCNPASDNSKPENWSLAQNIIASINGVNVKANPGKGCTTPTTPQLSFVFKEMLVNEDSLLNISILLRNGNGSPVTGRISVGSASTLSTSEYSATPALPYDFSFDGTQNEASISFSIQLIDDNTPEDAETLLLNLTALSNATTAEKKQLLITIRESEVTIPILFINELMASNTTVFSDEFGEYDDWVEIYNPNDFPVNIANFYISDKRDNLKKYRFPVGQPETIIAPKGFKIIWMDEQSSQGTLHTNFKLNALGEFIALIYKDGTTILDSMEIPPIATDVSYGRQSDASPTIIVINSPTPGKTNNTSTGVRNNTAFAFSAWPNPVKNGQVFLSIPGDYVLYDLNGKILKTVLSDNTFYIGDLPSGVYLIRHNSGAIAKIILQ